LIGEDATKAEPDEVLSELGCVELAPRVAVGGGGVAGSVGLGGLGLAGFVVLAVGGVGEAGGGVGEGPGDGEGGGGEAGALTVMLPESGIGQSSMKLKTLPPDSKLLGVSNGRGSPFKLTELGTSAVKLAL
jgi:hypothetical protein